MISVIFHIEPADGDVVVWAESPEMPGFTAFGASLPEVREFVRAELAQAGRADQLIVETLDGIKPNGWKILLLVEGIDPIEQVGTVQRQTGKLAVDPVLEFA